MKGLPFEANYYPTIGLHAPKDQIKVTCLLLMNTIISRENIFPIIYP